MIKLEEVWKRKKLVLLIMVLLISVLLYVSFVFTDITETTRHGITFWNVLFKGKLREFYIQNENVVIANQFGNSIGSIYDFPVYLLFALWNFPLWIYEKVTGYYALDTFLGLLWAKSISIPFVIGINYYIIKIGKKIKGEEFQWELSVLLFLSSVMFLVPVLIMGQYDALELLFILIGVYGYIKNDNKMFLFWFAVAVTFKMFALFVFVPLVLLREKRLIRVIITIIEGGSLLLFFKIFQKLYFIPSQVGEEYLSGHFSGYVFQSQIGFAYGGVSIFFLAFLLVCMYCYFRKKPNEQEMGRWAIYVSFLGLAVFFITSLTHPQWSLLLLPFSVLMICCENEQDMKIGMWIDTIFSTGLLLAEFIYYAWVFNIKTSVYTLAGKLFYDGKKDIGYSISAMIGEMLPGFNIDYLRLIGGGVFVAGILFYLYWSHPQTDKKKFAELEISYESIIILRILLMVVTGGLLIFLMV